MINSNTQLITRGKLDPKGHYVYLWRDGFTVFYVGVGIGRRAWNRHLPYVEQFRLNATHFSIYIVRDCLTKPQAHMLEKYFMRRHIKTIINDRIPSSLQGKKQ